MENQELKSLYPGLWNAVERSVERDIKEMLGTLSPEEKEKVSICIPHNACYEVHSRLSSVHSAKK